MYSSINSNSKYSYSNKKPTYYNILKILHIYIKIKIQICKTTLIGL
jgi:hypothetical protein